MPDILSDVPQYLLGLTLVLCFCAGWVSDNAMGDRGAGLIGNTFFLIVGAIGGLLLADHIGANLERDFLKAIAMAVGGAIFVLLSGCFVKSRWAI